MDYQFLIELGTGCTLAGYSLKKITEYMKVRATQATKQVTAKQGSFQGITAMVNNSEQILHELYKLRDDQLKNGVKLEQMKALTRNIQIAEFGYHNRSWLQYVAPMADETIGSVTSVIRSIAKGMGS